MARTDTVGLAVALLAAAAGGFISGAAFERVTHRRPSPAAATTSTLHLSYCSDGLHTWPAKEMTVKGATIQYCEMTGGDRAR